MVIAGLSISFPTIRFSEESGGRIVEENGEKFMLFYGMSSESAMKRHVGGVAEYRAAEGKTVKFVINEAR